jgi:hypothetical protein
MKNTTKLFDKKQCRSCSSKVTVKRVCLICNEPSAIWCENCFKLEDFEHVGHTQLELF